MKTPRTRKFTHQSPGLVAPLRHRALSRCILCSLFAITGALAQVPLPTSDPVTGTSKTSSVSPTAASPSDGSPKKEDATPSTMDALASDSEGDSESKWKWNPRATVSGDFLYGLGNVSLPFFHSLRLGDPIFAQNIQRQVISAPRSSAYAGTTVSFSPTDELSVDLSYSHGSSTGNVGVPFGAGFRQNDSTFKIEDDWYQGYLRYNLPSFSVPHFKHLAAYIRAGVSFVQADMQDDSIVPSYPNLYHQNDTSEDILGNLGFGLTDTISHLLDGRLLIALQLEAEGFFGQRTQHTLESSSFALSPAPTVTIDNEVYGVTSRATLKFQYDLGKSELWQLFADVGILAKYSFIHYPRGEALDFQGSTDNFTGATPTELLWGPYIKIGLHHSF